MKIQEKFNQLSQQPSDINQLLGYLKEFADKCNHITEMGVRSVISTYAFLLSNATTVIGYDIERHPNVDECEAICKRENKNWKFIKQDVLKADIEETDFLFIDTFHTASQLEKELELHASKAKKYIGFHDTTTFWENGESSYQALADKGTACGRGLKYAIEPFLKAHPEWEIVFRTEINNGLTIIERN